jgi:hypothetical protein
MKYYKYLLVGVISVLCVFTLLSGISHSGSVKFSRHDLSLLGGSVGFKFKTDQVCVFCHTPHGANADVRQYALVANSPTAAYTNTGSSGGSPILLWNRALSNAADGAGPEEGYKTYTSSTLDANINSVRIYSLLCLSCHDGIGALNVLTRMPSDGITLPGMPWQLKSFNNTGNPNQIGDLNYSAGTLNPNIGGRNSPTNSGWDDGVILYNDHPISFDYNNDLITADTGLQTPTYATGQGIRLFPNPGGTPSSLECPSCHNAHDQGGATSSGKFPFLRITKTGSAICLACHNK